MSARPRVTKDEQPPLPSTTWSRIRLRPVSFGFMSMCPSQRQESPFLTLQPIGNVPPTNSIGNPPLHFQRAFEGTTTECHLGASHRPAWYGVFSSTGSCGECGEPSACVLSQIGETLKFHTLKPPQPDRAVPFTDRKKRPARMLSILLTPPL